MICKRKVLVPYLHSGTIDQDWKEMGGKFLAWWIGRNTTAATTTAVGCSNISIPKQSNQVKQTEEEL